MSIRTRYQTPEQYRIAYEAVVSSATADGIDVDSKVDSWVDSHKIDSSTFKRFWILDETQKRHLLHQAKQSARVRKHISFEHNKDRHKDPQYDEEKASFCNWLADECGMGRDIRTFDNAKVFDRKSLDYLERKNGKDRLTQNGDRWDYVEIAWHLSELLDAKKFETSHTSENDLVDDERLARMPLEQMVEFRRQRRGAAKKAPCAQAEDWNFVTTRELQTIDTSRLETCVSPWGEIRGTRALRSTTVPSIRREVFEACLRVDGRDYIGVAGPTLRDQVNAKFAADKRFAEEFVLEQGQERKSIRDCIASAKKQRTATILTVIKGMEGYAQELGDLETYLVTLTAPGHQHRLYSSRYPDPKKRLKPIGHYDGTKPVEVARQLSHLDWAARQNALHHGPFFGLRVFEPHEDGTPHLHVAVFAKPDAMDAYIRSIENSGYTVKTGDKKENDKPAQVHVKQWKQAGDDAGQKGKTRSVASYLFPYILKSQEDHEYAVWKTAHSIYTFSFFGIRKGVLSDWKAAYQCSHEGAQETQLPPTLLRAGRMIRARCYSEALKALDAFEGKGIERLYEHKRSSNGTYKMWRGYSEAGKWFVLLRLPSKIALAKASDLQKFSISQGAASAPTRTDGSELAAAGWCTFEPPLNRKLTLPDVAA